MHEHYATPVSVLEDPAMFGRILTTLLVASVSVNSHTEQELDAYLSTTFEQRASEACRKVRLALWEYAIDLDNVTKQEQLSQQTLEYAKFEKDQWEQYFRHADWQNFTNTEVKRQLKILSVLGIAALDEASISDLNKHLTAMSTVYSTAKICPYKKQNCDLAEAGLLLDPGIEAVMANSNDYEELLYVWTEWRKVSGAKMRDDYRKYVLLNNKVAKVNGFQDMGEMWRNDYESDNFIEELDELWEQVKPLYTQLHTYVGNKLRTKYGEHLDKDGILPSHIFGNMWAQSWVNLYEFVRPYPDASPVDITAALKNKNYTILKMFEMADDFYKSLGLVGNEMSYDESKGAIISKPHNRQIVCHASAWDFCDGKDFRIKMCTKINGEDFVVIHHEMGHIQYYLQYHMLQPYTFRMGANPGFHEAVGDTIALSVSTPQHLQKIGLLDSYTNSKEDRLNALMQMALEKVAFLPFGLLIDKWRWDVFSGKVEESKWNAHWWKLREEIQKVKAPVVRTENDFDPGAKYHVPNDSQYIAYFVAHILQFQLHKALCIAAKQYDPEDHSANAQPLHMCDIYGSNMAGLKLQIGLQQGGALHWTDTLRLMTGDDKLDGSALLEYFKPLQEYLEQANASNTNEITLFIPITIGCVFLVVFSL